MTDLNKVTAYGLSAVGTLLGAENRARTVPLASTAGESAFRPGAPITEEALGRAFLILAESLIYQNRTLSTAIETRLSHSASAALQS